MNEQEMAVKLAETEARSKSNTHRLDKIEEDFDALNKLASAMEVMANEQNHQWEAGAKIKNDVTALGTKVDAIEKKPGKRWDGMVDKFLYGLAGVLAGALGAGLLYLLAVAA